MKDICSNCNRELELVTDGLCEECLIYRQDYYEQKELDERERYVIVSHEMAIDAGDQRLEGQLWKW